MPRERNGLISGSVGAILTASWGVYSTFTTARDLPADAEWLAKMMADPPIYAPWLLFVASVIFVAWLLWKRPKDDIKESQPVKEGNSQISQGDNSPNFVGTFGDVHIGSGLRLGNDAPAERVGDMPILNALDHILSVRGHGVDAVAELRQAAVDGRIMIWGCEEITGAELSFANRKWRTVWTAIPRGYWADWEIVRDRGLLSVSDQPHTEREDGLITRQTYSSLRVRGRDITIEWRRKVDPGPHPPTALGPNGWMAG